MKFLTLLFLVSLVFFISLASAKAVTEEELSICKEYSSVARELMNMRQLGMPMDTIMSLALESENSMLISISEGLIEFPVFRTDAFKEQAATEYSDMVWKECYSAFK